MEKTIVLYASAEHLNPTVALATFISTHYPTVPITIISTAVSSAVASTPPSVTYRRLPDLSPPQTPIKNHVEAFFETPRLHNPILRAALEEISQKSQIVALVLDFFCNAACQVSAALGIPTYFYITTGALGVAVLLNFPTLVETVDADIGDMNEYLQFPGTPSIHSSDLPEIMFFRGSNVYSHFLETANNMRKSCGILANGFDGIEIRLKHAIENGLCVPGGVTPPLYLVGPQIPKLNPVGDHDCLRWLDSQPRKTVVFLCFGRRGLHSSEQLRETAVALERSGHRFLWSLRNPPGNPTLSLEEILPEGFLERTKDRGFVVRTWAPQREVLGHQAVAGFVTHCGRSSVMEAVASGVAMIAWPLYAEQRMNKVFLVEEMKAALPLHAAEGGFVTADELERRVRELMDSNTGREIRRRVAEMKASAAAALGENGTSVLALHNFINDCCTRV
ncbi:chalcone 4'-O-glucosyltransferase-like [Salvia hispanica]|uniref:chalcone 4'-O-glucosyltransferase-like n=1 Tax=Salvia hispanica TaxID=49212 RepID=UPI0020099C33|nr:chalcone 4'-O-glucosyltransferase-like [Salvia hispanica]